MKHLTQVLLALFWKFGGPGLLVLGILDSSFLFAPLKSGLCIAILISRHYERTVCVRNSYGPARQNVNTGWNRPAGGPAGSFKVPAEENRI